MLIGQDMKREIVCIPTNCTWHTVHAVPVFHMCMEAIAMREVWWRCVSPYPGEILHVEAAEKEGFVEPSMIYIRFPEGQEMREKPESHTSQARHKRYFCVDPSLRRTSSWACRRFSPFRRWCTSTAPYVFLSLCWL